MRLGCGIREGYGRRCFQGWEPQRPRSGPVCLARGCSPVHLLTPAWATFGSLFELRFQKHAPSLLGIAHRETNKIWESGKESSRHACGVGVFQGILCDLFHLPLEERV